MTSAPFRMQTFEEEVQRRTVEALLEHIGMLTRAYRASAESAAIEGLTADETKALLESNADQLRDALYGAVAAWATSDPAMVSKAKDEGGVRIPPGKAAQIVKTVAATRATSASRAGSLNHSGQYGAVVKGSTSPAAPRTDAEIYEVVSREAQRRNPNDSPALAMTKFMETDEGALMYQRYREAPVSS